MRNVAVNVALLVNLLTVFGLGAMMLSMGLQVTFQEVLATVRNLRQTLMGLLANFVLVPVATLSLLGLFHADPMVSVGFLILAVCPGAPVGPPFASIAKGDVPFAIGQMVMLASLSALLSPLLLSGLLTRLLPGSDLEIDFLAIIETLLIAQIFPLALGLGVHSWEPELTTRLAKRIGAVANLLLLSAVVLLVVREFATLEAIRLRGWFGMLLLLAASLGIGWLCGGPGRTTRKTLALTTASRNAAVALVIVAKNFADTPAVTAVIAYSLVSIVGSLGCAMLFGMATTKRPEGWAGLAPPI